MLVQVSVLFVHLVFDFSLYLITYPDNGARAIRGQVFVRHCRRLLSRRHLIASDLYDIHYYSLVSVRVINFDVHRRPVLIIYKEYI